jgi:hypothetical protein
MAQKRELYRVKRVGDDRWDYITLPYQTDRDFAATVEAIVGFYVKQYGVKKGDFAAVELVTYFCDAA